MRSFDSHEPTGSPSIGAGLIDRLIDGDLDDGERRSLLLRLEAEPDGWRRCALGFLEAQAWRETIGGLARPEASPIPAPIHPPPVAHLRRPRLRPLAAWAAGLAAAFALGWATGGSPRPGGNPEGVLAQEKGLAPSPAVPEAARPEGLPAPSVADQPNGSGSPATDSPGPLRAEAATRVVPDHVRGQLERRGYRVEQRRGVLISVRDGRRVALPVEQVKIRFVGRGSS